MNSTSQTETELTTRIRQQEVVKELGQQALRENDIDQLMYDVSVAVSETLNTEFSKVLELSPLGDEVFLRQGIGWRDGIVGQATVPTDRDSQAGYTLLSEKPIIVDDLRTEQRFSGPELLTNHDVVSGISVIIGSVDDPWGVLGTHTRERLTFNRHDADFVKSVSNVLAAAIDRAEKEQRLREREVMLERYKEYTDDVLDAVDDLFYVLDDRGNLRRWNETLTEVTGYTDDEITSMHGIDFFDENTQPRIANAIEEGFETGKVRVEADLLTRDGEHVPYEFVAASLDDPDGNHVLVGIGRDVTERRENQRKLTESERRYRTLVEHFPNGKVALFDENLRYTLAGGKILDELGISPEEMVGTSVEDRYPDDALEDILPNYRGALAGETNVFETRFYDRDWLVYTLPIRDENGDVFAGMAMIQNITEQKRNRRRLEESNERLEQFAYAASHDLQEPLRMVSSYLQLIERRYSEVLDEDGQEFLEFAVDGAERMREMINGLLAYSRVDTRGDPFAPVDLNAIFEDASMNLQVKIEESDAEITTEPLPHVVGDARQLEQVFQNLLDNAIKYSGDEPPKVSISAERRGPKWRISVIDEGIGIDPDDAERIFEVFQSNRDQNSGAGSGIGLAIAERIVERHDGDIWVESNSEKGATFSFTLPDAGGIDE